MDSLVSCSLATGLTSRQSERNLASSLVCGLLKPNGFGSQSPHPAHLVPRFAVPTDMKRQWV